MRPIKVEFQAFGPYVGHEVVDFESLSAKGLFLICGKTGTGKTTILDAMTFALFGKSSGHGRDDFKSMRCTNAEFETDTFVRFEFENNGEFFAFERRLERKRKNLSDAYDLAKMDADGVWQPLFENPKASDLNKKAVEIVGLDYDQFRQVIVLPQGQFEKLLTSNSDEKEKILSNIFGVEKWNKIADKMFEEADARKKQLTDVRERILTRLGEEHCSSMAEFSVLIENKKKQVEELDLAYKHAEYEKKIKEQREQLSLVKRFGDFQKANDRLQELNAMGEERDQWENELAVAKKAEKVRPYIDGVKKAEKELQIRAEKVNSLENDWKKAESACKEAQEELKTHKDNEPAIESKKNEKLRYESKREDYKNTDDLKTEYDSCIASEKNAQIEAKKAKDSFEKYDESILELKNAYDALMKEHELLMNTYIAGMSGELAKALTEGKPCPVCGSTTHPQKAVLSENSVTRQQVDAKKKEADARYDELQRATNKKEEAKTSYDAKLACVAEAQKRLAIAKEKLDNNTRNLVDGIGSLQDLEHVIEKLEKEILRYGSDKDKLEETAKKTENQVAESKATLESATKEKSDAEKRLEQAKKELDTSITTNSFQSVQEVQKLLLDEDALNALANRISEHDASLKATRETAEAIEAELKNKQKPDELLCRQTIDSLESDRKKAEREQTSIATELARLEKKLVDLNEEGEGIEDKIVEAEEDFAFAKKLRGDAGTGLQRYVLGIMFSSVIKAANGMLEKVHGGRYRLFRSDDKAQGSNKRGLDLKVTDRYSEEHEGRFVSTLSGGEKFLASLALSIGMSTVAQKSGIKIDALFIDEGFGSLDEDCIADAMDILNGIQESNGIVGIISHVQLLQERIPTKLRIEQKNKGSHIIQTVG